MSDADVVTDDVTEQRRAAAAAGMAPAWWATHKPEEKAILASTGDRTFAELNANANRVVRTLRDAGLVAGDAVALMSRNRAEWIEVYAACLRGGWRLTPVNWHLTAAEAAYIVDDCEAKALFVDASLGEAGRGSGDGASGVRVKYAIGGPLEGFDDYTAAIAAADPTDIDDPSPGSTMLYTSGTTGRPKGVHRPMPRTAARVDEGNYRNGGVHLCTGPLYHGGPLAVSLHPPLTLGIPIVLMDKWDPEETLRLIDQHKVTHTHMVPTMFHRLLALPDDVRSRYDVSSLVSVWHGAAPCPVHVKRRMIEWWGPVIYEYYSATEGFGCSVDSKTWLEHPGTVGKPVDENVIVGDDDANPLPANEVGLLWIRAPRRNRFAYFKDDAKTSQSYRGDRFTLGDMGYVDDDGYLYLTDRSANLIISGGVNIYPAEVDAVLLEHPAVADAATIGVPNDEWGEEVKAVVELKPGVTPSPELAEELSAWCRERLAHFKCPRSIDFRDSLPRSESGKVYKRRLRDEYRASAGS
ncbi:MAG TPA: AMP-binding protein [Acidimicrobiales bacterium]|nr:AMP-binding protein [Acidimicrobiales bacterium]